MKYEENQNEAFMNPVGILVVIQKGASGGARGRALREVRKNREDMGPPENKGEEVRCCKDPFKIRLMYS